MTSNSFLLMKSPSGKVVLEILFVVLLLTVYFYFLGKSTVLEILKLILAVLVFAISAQVALVPLIAPRISVEGSTMVSATLRGTDGFTADIMTIKVRPPLFPMFPSVDIPVAYSSSTQIYPLDKNPLLDVSKSGNMLHVKVNSDGWTVEDIKTRIYIEHEASLNRESSIPPATINVLKPSEKFSDFQNYPGVRFTYSLTNHENFSIQITDWYVSINPKEDKELWGALLQITGPDNNCIKFFAEDRVDNQTILNGPLSTDNPKNEDVIDSEKLRNNQTFNVRLFGIAEPKKELKFFIHAYAVPCAS